MSDFVKNDVQAPKTGENIQDWLKQQLNTSRSTLLAFADDGVIWGKLVDGELVTSHDIDGTISPTLRSETLQQAFVFGAEDEVRLFRDESTYDEDGVLLPGEWQALRVVDAGEWFPESQILWGDQVEKPVQRGFIYATEYRAGIVGQWLPLDSTFGKDQCARLEVHHLVEFDEKTGEARIVISRLACLRVDKRDLEVVR